MPLPAQSSAQSAALRGRVGSSSGRGEEKLSPWLLFSFVVHGSFIVGLFLMPHLPSRTVPPPPVYTVDLVGGERIGRTNLGTELHPAPAPKVTATKTSPEPAAPVPEKKKEVKPAPEIKKEAKKEPVEKPEKVEKVKPVEKRPPAENKVVLNEPAKKAPAPKELPKESPKETPSESKAEEDSLDRVRERLIQAAVERVKTRTGAPAKASGGGEVISAGTGEGEGAAALGEGGRGGGVVKGIEFIAYQNKVFSIIRDNWAWPGQRSDLKVTVRFGIRDNGEIVGIKLVQPSGDPSYDESVVRAVKKSSPLPPPPESYRKDFSDVELNFLARNTGK